ncbi:hypothetical protein [Gracilibacillus saliphilus]|uniref:hypothetical protein n=1 Tax=Gracilibacillus saliphilus TaxID=543890 RepID=UPI0013D74CC6|nr:hypothetical protein [Gracilibacillus saliphilus]
MSKNLETLNDCIFGEVNKILYTLGLYDTLQKFGNPQVSGSYSLKMMTWRDLDIYLESDTISNKEFFDLGKEISLLLSPSKMSYRNELIGKTPHLPNGLYWGVHTNLFGQRWKIDISAIGPGEVKEKQNEVEKLKDRIDNAKRKSILSLKNQLHSNPKYRKKFFSVDIYDAVINNNIKSLEQFDEWIYIKKGIEL